MSNDLAAAFTRGDSYDRIVRDMSHRFKDVAVSNIARLVQTEGTYVARAAQAEEFQAQGIEEYEIETMEDGHVCPTCVGAAREPHRFADMRPGENYPPLHPRCRCVVNPAVADWDAWLDRQADRERARLAARRFGAEDDVRLRLNTTDDPAVEYFGSAENSNPEELKALKRVLEKNGVELSRTPTGGENIGYSVGGRDAPGRLHYTEGMSWAAWLHENDHFERDRSLGYPGMGFYLMNPDVRADMERSAYELEIELARKAGYDELVARLERLRDAEIGKIMGGVG